MFIISTRALSFFLLEKCPKKLLPISIPVRQGECSNQLPPPRHCSGTLSIKLHDLNSDYEYYLSSLSPGTKSGLVTAS